MLKRVLWILLTLTLFGVFPAAAQQSDPIDPASFVPADFAGFIRIHTGGDADQALRGLNIVDFAAARLSPLRLTATSSLIPYDTFIPISTIFDTDKLTFADTILPWLDGDIVLAYRKFDAAFQVDAKDTLMILPTTDIFGASSQLSAVIKAQDLPKQETYRDITIYIGDTSSFAVTAQAVFFGSTDTVKAALDIQAGAADRLIDSPTYGATQAATTVSTVLSAYVTGSYILPALNGLLNGATNSQVILESFGEALSQMRSDPSFEARLLSGGFDAASVNIRLENNGSVALASAVLHSADTTAASQTVTFDDSLLNWIPRSAMLVHSGTNASGFVYDVMTALPLSNFARQIFSGWPFQTVGTDNPLTPAPSANEIQSAVSSYLAVLSQFNKFNLQTDLLDHLSGNYVVALMPRPNNPVPVLSIPADVLIVAQSDDTTAAQNAVSTLLQALFGLKPQSVDPVDGWNFVGLGNGKTTVFRIGTQNNTLLIATGTADQDAIRAQNGDNRFTNLSDWKDLTPDGRPDVYIDLTNFYNTFFPAPGGASPASGLHTRATLRLQNKADGLYQLDLRVALPVG